VSVTDLSQVQAHRRWPNFISAVGQRGTFRAVHALPLRLRGQAVGVLSLFHRTPGALPAEDLALGQALADVATIGILRERTIRESEVLSEQLQAALNSRVIIEQAKGVLAERSGIGVDVAFDALRRYSRSRNRRLVEVARELVAGDLDLPLAGPDARG
jgi:GAF domain-containing protein